MMPVRGCIAVLLALLLLVLAGGALADDVYSIDLDKSKRTVSTDCDYIRLTCTLKEACTVTVTVTGPDGDVSYSRDYGEQSGSFRSDKIYLRSGSNAVTYQVEAAAGTKVYQVQVEKRLPQVKNAPACAAGYPLSAIGVRNSWECLTLLEVPASGTDTVTVPLCASGSAGIGSAVFTVSNGSVTVKTKATDGVSIGSCMVYVAVTADQARRITDRNTDYASGRSGKPIAFNDARVIAVYLSMQVDYDLNTVSPAPQMTLDGQKALWDRMAQ